jgi:hypothetical protein
MLKLTNGRQLRAARVLLGWNQAKCSINSQTGTLYKVQVALERGGIEFLDDDRPGVRLRSLSR